MAQVFVFVGFVFAIFLEDFDFFLAFLQLDFLVVEFGFLAVTLGFVLLENDLLFGDGVGYDLEPLQAVFMECVVVLHLGVDFVEPAHRVGQEVDELDRGREVVPQQLFLQAQVEGNRLLIGTQRQIADSLEGDLGLDVRVVEIAKGFLVDAREVALADLPVGVAAPVAHPDDGAAVEDRRRAGRASVAVAARVHAERDVQVLLHARDELALLLLVVLGLRLELGQDLAFLVARQQPGDLAAREETVHALQEGDVDDLALVEHEDDVFLLLLREFGEQLDEVLVELADVLVLVDVQVELVLLEDFLHDFEHHRFARPAEPDEHHVPQGLVEDPFDLEHVLDDLVEHDHLFVAKPVVHEFVDFLLQLLLEGVGVDVDLGDFFD